VERVTLLNADAPEQSCGIGALSIAGMRAEQLTATLLNKFKIHVRTRVMPGEFECIRVTPNIYASLEDVDRFSRAIIAIARG
jgi:selenocysteine lyase/cysteine desulfurase